MGQAVGQSFKSAAPFGERIFTSMGRLGDWKNLTALQPQSISPCSQTLAYNWQSGWEPKPSSDDSSSILGVSDDDIRFLRSRVMETPRQAEEITGRNIKGFRLESLVHAGTTPAEGRWLSWFLVVAAGGVGVSAIHFGR